MSALAVADPTDRERARLAAIWVRVPRPKDRHNSEKRRARHGREGERMTGENGRKNYAALRLEFARWKMLGDGSQRDWARAHGVSEQTLSEWNAHPEVKGLLAGWRDLLSPEVAMVAKNMLRLALGDGPQAVGAANWVAKVFGLEAPQKVNVTGRMTLADFLSEATFAEQPAPDARLS